MIQNKFDRTLSVVENLGVVRALLQGDGERSRTEVADRVCQHFGFHDARGRAQCNGCLKALRELERVGHFRLPSGTGIIRLKPSSRGLAEPVPASCGVPSRNLGDQGLD